MRQKSITRERKREVSCAMEENSVAQEKSRKREEEDIFPPLSCMSTRARIGEKDERERERKNVKDG